MKVADFGLAKKFSNTSEFNCKGGCATWEYSAPERLDKVEYSFPSDIWYFYTIYVNFNNLNFINFLKGHLESYYMKW